MYFKPPQNNMTNPFYHPLNKQPVQEAVTVEMEFKTDADGAAVVGSETKSRGMLISGQKVKNKVYRLTFKNNNVMNQFMKTYDNKLNEEKELDPAKHVSRSKRNPDMFCVFDKDGEEVKLFKNKSDAIEYAKKNHDALMESTPEYRAMMKRYKGSDMEKVFKILDKEGFRMGEQSDTLVRNMLKKHRGNVKKAADQIMKDNPGMFDVNRMMMDDVQIDEKVMTFTFRKTEDAREFEREASSLANATDIMMMPGGKKTGVEISTMGPKDDKRLISLAKKMGGRVHKIVEGVQLDEVKATARNIVKGLSDSDGPFTVVAMKRDKVIKQESTKMRNMLPAIIGEMRKEVGSGVTIAIEDRRGTIRNTFKEGVERVIDNLDDYLAEGSE